MGRRKGTKAQGHKGTKGEARLGAGGSRIESRKDGKNTAVMNREFCVVLCFSWLIISRRKAAPTLLPHPCNLSCTAPEQDRFASRRIKHCFQPDGSGARYC